MPRRIIQTSFTLLILVSIIFFISCGNGKVDYDAMVGKWSILEAQRNGHTTQTLENVYFNFSTDKKMQTNLFGSDIQFDIEFEHPKITTASSHLEEIYVIQLVGDTLRIRTNIDDFKYNLDLLKTDQ